MRLFNKLLLTAFFTILFPLIAGYMAHIVGLAAEEYLMFALVYLLLFGVFLYEIWIAPEWKE
jgi:hypothetical protein